jgi:hypothetical protein
MANVHDTHGLKLGKAAKAALLKIFQATLNAAGGFRPVLSFPLQGLDKYIVGDPFGILSFAHCFLMQFGFFLRGKMNCQCHSLSPVKAEQNQCDGAEAGGEGVDHVDGAALGAAVLL